MGFETYKSRSSAYNDTFTFMPKREIPSKPSNDRRAIDKGSMARAKINGDRGQPCLVPRERQK